MGRKATFITEADLAPPHKMRRYDYVQSWYRRPVKKRLRTLYENDIAAYLANYQPDKSVGMLDFCIQQEYGMKVFRSYERKLIGQHWGLKGEAALLKSVDLLRTRSANLFTLQAGTELDSEVIDLPVLVAIDVEGDTWSCRGLKEFGFATIDLREFCLAMPGRPAIHSANYVLSQRQDRRKFLFDFSQRFPSDDLAGLRNAISSHLCIPDPLAGGKTNRRVILVGHGVSTETRCLEELGLTLESLPMIVGTVDTGIFASKVLGLQVGSLEKLIDIFGIALYRDRRGRAGQLHCAGNDANYTLRVVLALLEVESRDKRGRSELEMMRRIARENIPVTSPGLNEIYENSEDEGLAGTFLDDDCES